MKKKIISLLVIFIACFGVFLSNAEAKEKVTVYLFSQTTCSHCREAKAFFKKLKQDLQYKDMFELRDISINSEEHKDYRTIYENVAFRMGDEADGVPYYVIGNKSFSKGYSSKMDDEIKEAIKSTYNQENFVSPIADLVGESGEILYEDVENNWLAPVIVLVIALAIIGGTIYFASRTGKEEKTKEIKHEEKKEEPKKEVKTEKIVKEKEPEKKSQEEKKELVPETKPEPKKETKKNPSKPTNKNTTKKKSTTTAKKKTTKKSSNTKTKK